MKMLCLYEIQTWGLYSLYEATKNYASRLLHSFNGGADRNHSDWQTAWMTFFFWSGRLIFYYKFRLLHCKHLDSRFHFIFWITQFSANGLVWFMHCSMFLRTSLIISVFPLIYGKYWWNNYICFQSRHCVVAESFLVSLKLFGKFCSCKYFFKQMFTFVTRVLYWW